MKQSARLATPRWSTRPGCEASAIFVPEMYFLQEPWFTAFTARGAAPSAGVGTRRFFVYGKPTPSCGYAFIRVNFYRAPIARQLSRSLRPLTLRWLQRPIYIGLPNRACG